MYLEAALVLQKSPLLLKRLEDFEIRVLSFMVKEDLLNAELIMQIVELAGRYREYHPGLVDTLEKIYAKNPDQEPSSRDHQPSAQRPEKRQRVFCLV